MPEDSLTTAWLLALALAVCMLGMAWLALSMQPHWQQVRGDTAGQGVVLALRGLGAACLLASLLICLRADHASMAALVWVMALAGSALAVALTLSWRPRALAWLVACVPPTAVPGHRPD